MFHHMSAWSVVYFMWGARNTYFKYFPGDGYQAGLGRFNNYFPLIALVATLY